jgi:hypothetical protein
VVQKGISEIEKNPFVSQKNRLLPFVQQFQWYFGGEWLHTIELKE